MRSRPADREPIKSVCFASAPRQTLMLPGGSPPDIAPAASGRRGTHNRGRVGNSYPAFGVSGVHSPSHTSRLKTLARPLFGLLEALLRHRKIRIAPPTGSPTVYASFFPSGENATAGVESGRLGDAPGPGLRGRAAPSGRRRRRTPSPGCQSPGPPIRGVSPPPAPSRLPSGEQGIAGQDIAQPGRLACETGHARLRRSPSAPSVVTSHHASLYLSRTPTARPSGVNPSRVPNMSSSDLIDNRSAPSPRSNSRTIALRPEIDSFGDGHGAAVGRHGQGDVGRVLRRPDRGFLVFSEGGGGPATNSGVPIRGVHRAVDRVERPAVRRPREVDETVPGTRALDREPGGELRDGEHLQLGGLRVGGDGRDDAAAHGQPFAVRREGEALDEVGRLEGGRDGRLGDIHDVDVASLGLSPGNPGPPRPHVPAAR